MLDFYFRSVHSYVSYQNPKNIPNLLTMLRVVLIPVFIFSFFLETEHRYLISAFI
ncbi:MAG: CDP-alcohol phosphatidyltransferase family protein, partial [Chitinophagales bacterium]